MFGVRLKEELQKMEWGSEKNNDIKSVDENNVAIFQKILTTFFFANITKRVFRKFHDIPFFYIFYRCGVANKNIIIWRKGKNEERKTFSTR